MVRSPRTVVAIALVVVAATILPVVALGATPPTPDERSQAYSATGTTDDATIRLHRAPNDTAATALPDYVGVGEPSDPVFFPGDALVVSVQSKALAANLSDAAGDNLTERFVASQAEDPRLRVVQTNPRPEVVPLELDLSDAANLTVVAGELPGTYHVVVDTAAAEFVRGDPRDSESPEDELRPGMAFHVGFDGDDDAVDPSNRTIRVGDAEVDVPTTHADGVLRLEPTADATVTGRVTLPPSTPIAVELVDRNGSSVVASDRVVVERVTSAGDATFRFAASFDLADEGGREYELHLRSNGTALLTPVPVAVVPREASVSVENDTTRWGTTVESATLTHGGFVVLHRGGSVDGETLGVSSYVGPSTTNERVGVRFDESVRNRTTVVAVPYRDVNANGEFDAADEPYRENGSPVTDTAVLEPAERGTISDPATTVTSTTDRPDTATTPTLGMADPTETADESIPGFGVVAVLVALSALVALRRR